MSNTVTCDKCGTEYGIGDWPMCPHGKPRFHVDAFAPQYDEMLSTDGLTYSSNREKVRYMDRNAIVEKDNPYARSKALYFDMGRR